MKKLIIINLIILINLSFINFALAQDLNKSLEEWLDRKIINPLKQGIETAPEKAEKTSQRLSEQLNQEKQEVKEEIKQGVKEEIRKLAQRGFDYLKEKLLNPLKNQIQKGSGWIRNQVKQVGDYLKSILKSDKS